MPNPRLVSPTMENPLEEGKEFQQKKNQDDPVCRPDCDHPAPLIRSSVIKQKDDHLTKLQLNKKVKKSLSNENSKHEPQPGCSSKRADSSEYSWEEFQKIFNYWHSDLKIRTRVKETDDQLVCPICNERPNEDINVHVGFCLKKSENGDVSGAGSDDNKSIEEESSEFEWTCEKPIRTSRVLEGGYSAAGRCTPVSNWNTGEEDKVFDVDEEDTQKYGAAQSKRHLKVPRNSECENEENANFDLRKLPSDQDISLISSEMFSSSSKRSNIHINSEEENANFDLRKLPSDQDISLISSEMFSSSSKRSNIHINSEEAVHEIWSDEPISSISDSFIDQESNNSGQIIEDLKTKIQEYENQIRNKIKCFICLEDFWNPAVSICCWHVHCEECWLRTLEVRMFCPQCDMFTSPTDLRRVYF